jgi:hypothetical protein
MSDDLGNKTSSDELKKKILSSMNTSFTGDATNRWITAMKDEAFDEVEEAVTTATESSKLNHSMAAVIDRLFDNFKRYSFEYNRTQDDREFEINCERPASMRTSAEYQDMGKPIKYCLGHLASRNWALIIQGEENRILSYITPVEQLLGFRPSPTEFPPHLEMRLSRDTGKTSREFVWSISGQMLAQDSLPVLARRLFTQLVKVTKGEANYGELFAWSPQEEKLAIAYVANAPIDRAFDDDQTNLLGQKKPDLSERTFVVAAEQLEQFDSAMAPSQAPANPLSPPSPPSYTERPPLNAMINPSPIASSLSASSSYPQVAAAIANGEPKALNPQTDAAQAFPASQTISEQAQTYPRLPAPGPGGTAALAPARTFVAQPSQLSNDDAIAALIFPAPPGERPAQGTITQSSAPVFAVTPGPVYAAEEPAPLREASPASTEVPETWAQSHPDPAVGMTGSEAPVREAAPAEEAAPPPASPSSPWIGPNGEPARVPSPSQTSMEIPRETRGQSNDAMNNNGQPVLTREAAENRAKIAQSLKGLFDTVDSAINGLTAVGMTAMHADDLVTVSAVMKQTKSLKCLRDGVVALSKDWQKTVDE